MKRILNKYGCFAVQSSGAECMGKTYFDVVNGSEFHSNKRNFEAPDCYVEVKGRYTVLSIIAIVLVLLAVLLGRMKGFPGIFIITLILACIVFAINHMCTDKRILELHLIFIQKDLV